MSSSGTTEPGGDGLGEAHGAALGPPSVDPPRRPVRTRPAILVLASVLALLVISIGLLALLGQGSTTAPPVNALVGEHLDDAAQFRLTAEHRVGHGGQLGPNYWGPHGAVLLFFADWCTACHSEVPRLAAALGRGDVSGVRVIGFDDDLSPTTAASFVRANHVRFPVAWDGRELLLANQLAAPGLPTAVFVKGSSRIVAVDYGPLTILQLDAGLSLIGRPAAA